jgi:phosphoribosylamine--glycine ligase
VGPELPLSNGIVDKLSEEKIAVFGPNKTSSQLESSKIFMKNICKKHNIPTAKHSAFDNEKEALNFLDKVNFPTVIKADGLAAGKGVVIVKSKNEATETIKNIMSKRIFGASGKKIIIEEFLEGEEISFFALVDTNGFILPLTTAQDHKKIGEGDAGLNTGGMGAYSPVPFIKQSQINDFVTKFVKPIINDLKYNNIFFSGVFYAGLILTKDGPKLLEINVRFGDPEVQAVLPRLKTDLLDLLLASSKGKLDQLKPPEWDNNFCMNIVIASKGYPESYKKNTIINGLNKITTNKSHYIFHSSTKKNEDHWLATGGRVLSISALGSTLKEARNKAYNVINKIDWKNGYFRKDIGWKHLT